MERLGSRGAQKATPRYRRSIGSRAKLTGLPKEVGAWSSSAAVLGAGRSDSYPEAAEREAAVGRGGCSNPLSAAGRRALGAAGICSRWRKGRPGTARLQSPGAGRLLPAGGVGAGGGLSAPGSFRALPPAGLPAGSGGGSGAAGAKRRWGHVGRQAGAEAAADPAIPQPATGSHLCRDKG